MSERFERIFTLPENLHTAGAPVVIAAGALLKDTETGNILAQLKFKNIGPNPIKAVKVRLIPLDTVGKPLGEDVSYEYLDLNAERDMEFGQKKAIPIPNPSSRSFAAEVTEVAFADNSVWSATGNAWTPLPESVPLEKALGDRELTKQYKMRYGEKAAYQPIRGDEVWLCACGAVNTEGEEACHICGNKADSLFACGLEGLKAERDQRVEQENEAIKKKKKRGIIAAVLAVILVVAIAVPVASLNKRRKIEKATLLAEECLDKNDYFGAIEAYASIDSTSGIQSVTKKMGVDNAKRIAVFENGVILVLTSDKRLILKNYQFNNPHIVNIAFNDVDENSFKSICLSYAEESPMLYSFDVSKS